MEDVKIIELYFERNEDAILYTSEKYGRRLFNISKGIVQDNETAEECENDTYSAAWNCIPPKEPKEHFFAFLAKIIRNISINFCRKQHTLKRSAYICELSSEMEECIPAPDNCQCRIDDIAFAEAINGFLSTLSSEKRSMFLRRYWYLDSVSDIAENFGFTESKVKSSLYRIREELRKYLIKEGYSL